MKKSEGLYLIRDESFGLGTGETGKRDNRLRRLEQRTLETLIQFVKFGFEGQSLRDWNNQLR